MQGVEYLVVKVAAGYRWLLARPAMFLALLLAWGLFSAYHMQDFYYDASADTLVAENDPELLYYRKVTRNFGGEDFLFLTYTPKKQDLITRETLADIDELETRLEKVPGVATVTSILDAPLLNSPPVSLSELAEKGYVTLKSPRVDFEAAKKELTTSPLFKNLLISEDGNTTALRIELAEDENLQQLARERNRLRLLKNPSESQKERLKELEAKYREVYAAHTQELDKTLDTIRHIRDSIEGEAEAYLGGVPMIASDMIRYVKKDLYLFGGSALFLMVFALYMFFRKWRWVFLPLAVAAVSVFFTIGLLGFLHKPVTVVSSNFVSLLIILSISIVVHLVTRYRELLEENRTRSNLHVVCRTMASKLAPCIYTTLTTGAGFASLGTSSIVPVMDFGWIMCMGVVVAFIVSFLLFPGVLLIMPREKIKGTVRDNNTPLVRFAYRIAYYRAKAVIAFSVVAAGATAMGVSMLSLDNSFIDYFDDDTEIHQGLTFIDKNMGGTMPMDVIIEFPPYEKQELTAEDDFFMGGTESEESEYPQRYWFTPDKIAAVHEMERYLQSLPRIGKTISIATLEEIAREYNDGEPLGAVEIVAILNAVPEDVRRQFIAPYADPDSGMMRISTRIHESGETFSRDRLVSQIETAAVEELGFDKGQVHVTGMNVLFNGMLKELFNSQASTILFVIGATLFMFWILLRSWQLAILGLLPNLLAAFAILGFMGFVGMPLDMMTLTIAAIVIGIGVDDAIHYLHRFKESYHEEHDVDAAVRKSHRHIGRALYITSLTVIIGFSVLCASNFVPTVYFGILTALAMILALFANLTILPALLIKFYKRGA